MHNISRNIVLNLTIKYKLVFYNRFHVALIEIVPIKLHDDSFFKLIKFTQIKDQFKDIY